MGPRVTNGIVKGTGLFGIFNNTICEMEELVEAIKVLSWRWTLSSLNLPACLFYEWSWNPKGCASCGSGAVFCNAEVEVAYAVGCSGFLSASI